MKWIPAHALAFALIGAGCAGAPVPRTAASKTGAESSPLGPSYVLVPVPSDDSGLLGRVLSAEPGAGRALEESAVPNPCLDKLEPAREAAMENSFEDAQQLSSGARAKTTLSMFGFSGDVQRATHFVYKIDTSKRIGRSSTTEYLACCKERDCGYGYVSALVYGTGEYASAEETSGSASVDVAFASAEGTTALKILHRRKVHGWMAAVVTVTGDKKTSFGVLGDKAAAGLTDLDLPQQVRALYDQEKIEVTRGGGSAGYVFVDGRGDKLTENEFARRYGKATGSTELGDVETRRNKASLIVWGSITAASAVTMVYFYSQTKCKERHWDGGTEICTSETTEKFGTPWFWLGALGTGVGGTFLIKGLFNYDGDLEDHKLTEYDAKLYAGKHNRSLLKKASKDVERVNRETSLAPLRIMPLIGAGYLGAAAAF